MRALPVFCGLLGLLAWTLVFRRLTEDTFGALLFMALMACDYINQSDVGTGRPDAMAFAFQAGAFAAYLHWREKNLRLAILLSQTLVVASGLTHPNGGMLSFLGALWRVVYFESPPRPAGSCSHRSYSICRRRARLGFPSRKTRAPSYPGTVIKSPRAPRS